MTPVARVASPVSRAAGFLVLTVAVAWLTGLPAAGAVSAADRHDDQAAVALLRAARAAAAATDFAGVVVVEWRSGGQLHRERVTARESAGVLDVGGRRMVAVGGRRFVREARGFELLWAGETGGSGRPLPPVTTRYRFTVRPGMSVAGRATTEVVARRVHGGVAERLAIDAQTGLLVAREELDAGHVLRSVVFESFSDPPHAASERARPGALPEATAGTLPARPITRVGAPYRAPTRLGRDFSLVEVYRRAEGIQAFYSDGLVALSVFERSGELAWDSLPRDGRLVDLAGRRAVLYDTPGGAVAVWEVDGVVYTCVSEGTASELGTIVAAFPRARTPSMLERAVRFVTGPLRWR